MSTRRSGFTLVELLVAAVLAAIIMGATYQSLITQERTHRTTSDIIRGQDAVRAALGILEAELREAATMGDPAIIGIRDITAASSDSLTIRAQRKIGFVCAVHPSDRRLWVWMLGPRDRFVVGDGILIFSDDNPNIATDDFWSAARVHQVTSESVACPSRPTGSTGAIQRVDVAALAGVPLGRDYTEVVRPGAPVRGFSAATYKLFAGNDGWFLGRRTGATAAIDTLVFGLAGPGQGLVFTYLDEDGEEITTDPVVVSAVAGVRITAKTAPRPGSGASAATVTSDIYFRNN
jgi:prepilin-type N-terminal cleavage/methylation domain-containing protein